MFEELKNSAMLVVMTLVVCTGCAVEPPLGSDANQAGLTAGDTGGEAGEPLHVAIVSMDAERNVPTMVWAERGQAQPRLAHDTAEAAARRYLEQHASLYRLSRADLQTVYVHRVHDIGRGGVIVFFRQRVGGIEVMRTELKVLMTRDLELVALTGSLQGGMERMRAEAQGLGVQAAFQYPPAKAVLSALGDLYGVPLADGVHPVGTASVGQQSFGLVPGGEVENIGISLVSPAQVIPVYYPVAGRLVPAYAIELLAERSGEEQQRGYEYVTHAGDGRVLRRRDRVASDTYSYQVWADADGTPRDGPQEDYTPHPTGQPDHNEPVFIPPTQLAWEGLEHADGTVDPWLPAGATVTAGNNVRAYADHYDPQGFTEGQDIQASVLPGTRNFHDRYDTSRGPLASEEQTKAAAVQLFYTTNWLHDYFYQSGFNESAGNAQDHNYGRGGAEGDALLAEAQNRGPSARERNNAVMYTPRDGLPPRMELYLWETPEERSLSLAGQRYNTGKAEFGAQHFSVEGPLVLARDGVAPSADGCQSFQNSTPGAIFLADRGNCLYELKAVNAEAAGAAGLIIINHVPGAPPPDMFDVDQSLSTRIPVLSVSYEDGQALKAMLASGAPRGTMARTPSTERDGTIDNTIIAHEWGHLLHHRLVDCSSPQCQAQSEGWADFIALHMMLREEDDPDGTYAIAGYAAKLLGDSAYYGIRRAPYSRDPAKNALRFRHIADGEPLPDQHPLRDNGIPNSKSHNAGEVWAAMLFDGYLALLDGTRGASPRLASFAEAKRRMADYVVAGMMLAPIDPTYTEQRDALLMAAKAQDPQDMLVLARAFAARGAGSCAVSPPRGSRDFVGVREDDALRPDVRLEIVQVDDDVRSFDGDGVLDAAEIGSITLKVTNLGPVALTGATLRVSASTSALAFPDGTDSDVVDVAPFSSGTMQVRIALDHSLVAPQGADFEFALSSISACKASTVQRRIERFNYDLVPSSTDTLEGHQTTWSTSVLRGGAGQAWQIVRSPLDERDHVWYARDGYEAADTVLETPELKVAPGGNLAVEFKHRYSFDYRLDPLTGVTSFWNGGVVEVTRDNGETWEDVRSYAETGYGGVISTEVGNNLGGRMAYVAKSASWPQADVVTLDLGTRLQGESVRLRFRLGSAWVFEAHGWEIDDVSVRGVERPPFQDVGNDTSSHLPVADAGGDQTVSSGEAVKLDGSGSRSSNIYTQDPVTFSWKQTAGPAVLLKGDHSAGPHFTAPAVKEDTLLAFEVNVSDGTFTASDTVGVLVRPPEVPLDPEEPCLINAESRPPHTTISGGTAQAYGSICHRPKGGLGGAAGYGCLSTGDTQSLPWPLWLLLVGLTAARSRSRGQGPRAEYHGGGRGILGAGGCSPAEVTCTVIPSLVLGARFSILEVRCQGKGGATFVVEIQLLHLPGFLKVRDEINQVRVLAEARWAEGRVEGHQSGLVDGKRNALLRLLARAGLALSEQDQARIQACTDEATFDRWLDNVLGARSAADVLS